MTENTKRLFGKVCIGYAALLLIGDLLMTVIPSMAEIAKRSWQDHIFSLFSNFIIGAIGLSLIRKKDERNLLYLIVLFILILVPVMNLHIALKPNLIEDRSPLSNSLQTVGLALAVGVIAIPYGFGKSIINRQKSKTTGVRATPHQVLNIIGLACSVFPSTIGFFMVLLGTPKNKMYYFIGLSYAAVVSWFLWWRYRFREKTKRFSA